MRPICSSRWHGCGGETSMTPECRCRAGPRCAPHASSAIPGGFLRSAPRASPSTPGASLRRASLALPSIPGALRRLARLLLAVAPAAALAMLPKCPLCLIAYLSAIGIGASAVPLAGAVYPIAGVIAAATACVLGVWLVRRVRRSRRVVPPLAVALAVAGTAIVLVVGAGGALRLAALAAP